MLRGQGQPGLSQAGCDRDHGTGSRGFRLDQPAAARFTCPSVNQILDSVLRTLQGVSAHQVQTPPCGLCLPFSSACPATQPFFLLLEQVKLILASEPLHCLFLLPDTLFLPLGSQMILSHFSLSSCVPSSSAGTECGIFPGHPDLLSQHSSPPEISASCSVPGTSVQALHELHHFILIKPLKGRYSVIPALQMGKLRHREVKRPAQDHPASKD